MSFASLSLRNPPIQSGAHMGEVIRFIPKAEAERARLIREARAIYDSIFPPNDRGASERRERSEER